MFCGFFFFLGGGEALHTHAHAHTHTHTHTRTPTHPSTRAGNLKQALVATSDGCEKSCELNQHDKSSFVR